MKKFNYLIVFKLVLYFFVFSIFILALKFFGENHLITKFEQFFESKTVSKIEKLGTKDRAVILYFTDSNKLRLTGDEYTLLLEQVGSLDAKNLKFQIDKTFLKNGQIHECITNIFHNELSIYKPAISVGSSKRNVFIDCSTFFKNNI